MSATLTVWDWVGVPALALFRQPVLLGELMLLVGILVFGFLRQLGAPLQFFHEDPGPQRWAGFASTVTVAHLFFVIYLLESGNGLKAEPLFVWFFGLWLGTVVFAVRACLRSDRPETANERPLNPPLKRVIRSTRADGSEHWSLGSNAGVGTSPWPFVQGVFLALLAAGALLVLVALVLAHFDFVLEPAWRLLSRHRSFLPGAPPMTRPGLHLLALLSFVVIVLEGLFLRRRLGSAAALCLLLSFTTAVVGATQFWTNGQLFVAVPALALLVAAGRELYALRVVDLAPVYAAPVDYPLRGEPTDDPEPLLADQLVSEKATPLGWPADGLPEQRPLVIVCASGGGLRAAVWTAGVLARLSERVPHFPCLTLLVTGASGGMVGASYWLAATRNGAEGREVPAWRELLARVSTDSLTPVLRTLTLNDVPRAFSWAPNPHDRGAALQESLGDDVLDLSVPLAALKDGERRRLWPSLVFSPMIVEDGRRLLLGNLRLRSVVASTAPWLSNTDGTTGMGRASVSAFHGADVFSGSAGELRLATAARLSAAFPYVSPAVVLPTTPRTRVVDAGYYDNFGVDLGTSFLREALEHQVAWLRAHVSRILVIQVQDECSPLDGSPDGQEPFPRLPPDRAGWTARLKRALEGLTSPIEAMLAARNSVMRLRNDAQFEAVFQAYERAFAKRFVTTQMFQLKGNVSLSWDLTRADRRTIEEQLSSGPIEAKLEEVAAWARAGLGATGST